MFERREQEAEGRADARAPDGASGARAVAGSGAPAARALAIQRRAGNAAGTAMALGRARLSREPVTGAEQDAEVVRLQEEFNSLMARNAYAGALRAYDQLVALGPERLARMTHFSGAQAEAAVNGPTQRYVDLLNQAISGAAADEAPEVVTEATRARDAFLTEFRKVVVTRASSGGGGLFGGGRKTGGAVEIVPAVVAFAPLNRRAVDLATKALSETGSFSGWLPLGDYTFNGAPVTVSSGNGAQAITCPDAAVEPEAPAGGG